MRYVSTRGAAPVLEFNDVLLEGLASDGGLYVPESLPEINVSQLNQWRDLSYKKLLILIKIK